MYDIAVFITDNHGHARELGALLEGLRMYGIFSDFSTLTLAPQVCFSWLGDYIDGGSDSRGCLSIAARMKASNPQACNLLMGNHELLALNDLDQARIALDCSNPFSYYMRTAHSLAQGDMFVEEFGRTPKEAFINYLKEMQPEAPTGRLLRSLSAYACFDIAGKRVVALHGGITKNIMCPADLLSFGRKFAQHIATPDVEGGYERKYWSHPLVNDDTSPIWHREPDVTRMDARSITDRLAIDYLVVGHANIGSRIRNYEDCAFNIDVNVSVDKRPAALIMRREGVFAYYLDGIEQLVEDLSPSYAAS